MIAYQIDKFIHHPMRRPHKFMLTSQVSSNKFTLMKRIACIYCWFFHDEGEDCHPDGRTRSACVADVARLGQDVEVPDGPEEPAPLGAEPVAEAAEEDAPAREEPIGPKRRGRPPSGAQPSGTGVKDREAYNKYMKDYRARKKREGSAKAGGGRIVH